MKNNDKMNLKGKTIFDFCRDKIMLNEIVGGYSEEYYKTLPLSVHYSDLRNYAARTNNVQLFNAATNALNKANDDFERLQSAEIHRGVIID